MKYRLLLLAGCAGLLGCGGGTTDADGFARQTGDLRSGDETLTSGEYADDYALSVEPGQWIEVAMTSSAFDPYVILRPPSCTDAQGACEEQVDNDDFLQNNGAFVWHQASEGGRWTVLATSSKPDEEGAYEVAYRAVAAGQLPATPGVAIGSGRTEQGALAEGDATLGSGEFVDRFGFVGRAGESVVIDLQSTAFDPYVILQPPSGQQLENDDWEGARDRSRIESTLPSDGMYQVLVTTYRPGEAGAYTLQVTPNASATGAGPQGGAVGQGGTGGQVGDPFNK